MRLSTSLNVLSHDLRCTPEAAIERLAALGFEALDFNFCDWCFPGSPFVGKEWERWVETAAKRAEACGIRFTQAHGPIFFKWGANEETHWMTELSKRSLLAAGRLGVPWVVFEPETANGAWDATHLETLRRRNVDWFSQLLPTAEQAGTGLALENVSDRHASSRGGGRWFACVPAELNSLVDSFATPRVGICWDTGHAQMQGLDQGAALRAMGSRLKALHIQDNNGKEDQHVAPYYGRVDWPQIMAALHEIAYQGDFTYEIHYSIRPLPFELQDHALRLVVAIGRSLLGRTPSNG